ncbi:sterigmatocystin biosynthesis monooxygenase stcW [Fusarium coicis]|nr:sterigmatocystin biosynthesis monooxygenase stcW [Fusarium coicis]
MSGHVETAATRAAKVLQELADKNPEPCGATEAWRGVDDVAYALSQLSLFTPRPIKIVAVGAGLSGLAIAHAVEAGLLPGAELTIYEKNAGIGGTWFENRCACDIPAHNYQFSWAPNPHWKKFYASRDDIYDYVKKLARQHDLEKFIKVSHKVTKAVWNEVKQLWEVSLCKTDGREMVISSAGVTDGETNEIICDECDILINATGFFNNWKWPNIPGREHFQGNLLHSAAWPDDADTKIDGKVVALIGNGSSGIQILPSIINKARKVYVHIRSATWVTTGLAERFAGPGGSNLTFSPEQKQRWAENPEEYLQYRKEVEESMSSRFRLYMKGSKIQEAARKFSEQSMIDKLEKGERPDLVKFLLPKFEVGCRRPTPGNGYLEALCSENCEVVWGGIDSFTSTGLRTSDGRETEVDTIICATGFDLSCAPRFPVLGRNGANLQERWGKNPESYLSVTATDMPNYFTYLGPASPLGHGSLTPSIEFVTNYIVDLVSKLQTQNYSSLCPKPHIAAAYQKQALAWLERTVWASNCTSTFKNGTTDGKLVSLHPGSRLHMFKLLSTPRYEDFDWTSLSLGDDTTFAWLANGFTKEEDDVYLGKPADLTYFLNPPPHTKPIVAETSQLTDCNGVKKATGS